MVKIYSGELSINSVNDIYNLFSKLGVPIDDISGVVVITSRKGFLKKYEVKYNVKIYMVGSNTFVFGVLKDEGSLEAFAKLYIKGNEWYFECNNKEYNDLCTSILNSIKKGIKLYGLKTPEKSNTAITHQSFKISKAFESFLDGFAEVIAASAAIKYPVIERKVVRLGELGDVLNIIEYLNTRYSSGKYVILMLGEEWMFSVAVDLDKKEFTPSLVIWSSNTRLLGEEALAAFKQLNIDENIRFSIYSLQE